MRLERTITIPKQRADFIRKALLSTDMMGENDTVTSTASFDGGIEMDIKLCGAREEHPWTEAVLFHNGSEVACSEPEEEYDGDWDLEYNGNTYIVHVVFSESDEDNDGSPAQEAETAKAPVRPYYALSQDEIEEVLKKVRR